MSETRKLFESYQANLKEADDNILVIHTGLSDDISKEILESVIGQLSDGIWENSSSMEKYWNFMDIDTEGGDIVIKVNHKDYRSGFYLKTEEAIKKWIAGKIKQIVKIEQNDGNSELKWDRNNTAKLGYMGYSTSPTVRDAYRVYDKLLGRVDRITESDDTRERYKKFLEKELDKVQNTIANAPAGRDISGIESKRDWIMDKLNQLEESDLSTVRQDSIEKGLLTENSSDNLELYMNTWANYNDYGADVEQINGGWMDLDKAKEFLEAHKDEEPFINDTNNCPISVSEYDSPWQIIEELEYINNVDNEDAFLAILDEHNDNFEEAKDIYESGDYIFFAGVDNDEDLGRAYVDMVGFEGVSNIENYLDRNQIEEDIRAQLEEMGEDVDSISDETIDLMVDEDIEAAAGNSDYIEKYFDYEALGRDLDFEGYYFANTGAIYTM